MRLLYTVLFLLFVINAQSQTIGTFDTSYVITNAPFSGEARTFSLRVPSDYDSTNTYPLVVGLHGYSQNSATIRGHLSFLVDSLNAILICPDGTGNQHDDQFGGHEINIVEEARQFAIANYKIDTTEVYLTGFSWGGRESAYYGLSEHEKFKGIIPFAPAIQNGSDANNNLAIPWANPFTFENGAEVPTCICIGTADGTFYDNVILFHEKMEDEGAIVKLNEIPGVGHTLSFGTKEEEYMECFRFFDTYLGIDENDLNDFEVSVYPNPFQDQLTITLEGNNLDGFNGKVEIHTISGALVYSGVINSTVTINQTLDSGIYILTLSDQMANPVYRKKIIKN